jgi:hypothetical protein
VTELLEIVSRLKVAGGKLRLDGERIRYSIPSGDDEARSLLAALRKRKSEVADLLRSQATVAAMPPGVRLVAWNLKEPPVAIETCAVVTDPALFARTSLEQLGTALAQPKHWVGWSVPQLIDRLAQVGVTVTLGIDKSSELES